MLSVSSSGPGVSRCTVNAPHCLSHSVCPLSHSLGPTSPQVSHTKCTQGLAGVTEQGEGSCPLASRPAEVEPVFPSPSVPAFVVPTPWATRDQTSWDSPGAISGVVPRMLGHICVQTLCISMSLPAPVGQTQHPGERLLLLSKVVLLYTHLHSSPSPLRQKLPGEDQGKGWKQLEGADYKGFCQAVWKLNQGWEQMGDPTSPWSWPHSAASPQVGRGWQL